MNDLRITIPTILILVVCLVGGMIYESFGLFYELQNGPKLITPGLPKKIKQVFKTDHNVLLGKLGTRASRLDTSCIFSKRGCLTVRELSADKYEVKVLGEDSFSSEDLQFLNKDYVGPSYNELETNRLVDRWAFPDAKTRKAKKLELISILNKYNKNQK